MIAGRLGPWEGKRHKKKRLILFPAQGTVGNPTTTPLPTTSTPRPAATPGLLLHHLPLRHLVRNYFLSKHDPEPPVAIFMKANQGNDRTMVVSIDSKGTSGYQVPGSGPSLPPPPKEDLLRPTSSDWLPIWDQHSLSLYVPYDENQLPYGDHQFTHRMLPLFLPPPPPPPPMFLHFPYPPFYHPMTSAPRLFHHTTPRPVLDSVFQATTPHSSPYEPSRILPTPIQMSTPSTILAITPGPFFEPGHPPSPPPIIHVQPLMSRPKMHFRMYEEPERRPKNLVYFPPTTTTLPPNTSLARQHFLNALDKDGRRRRPHPESHKAWEEISEKLRIPPRYVESLSYQQATTTPRPLNRLNLTPPDRPRNDDLIDPIQARLRHKDDQRFSSTTPAPRTYLISTKAAFPEPISHLTSNDLRLPSSTLAPPPFDPMFIFQRPPDYSLTLSDAMTATKVPPSVPPPHPDQLLNENDIYTSTIRSPLRVIESATPIPPKRKMSPFSRPDLEDILKSLKKGKEKRRKVMKEWREMLQEIPVFRFDEIEGVPGQPGGDYPTFSFVPLTSFTCRDKFPGYYADGEAGCQTQNTLLQPVPQVFGLSRPGRFLGRLHLDLNPNIFDGAKRGASRAAFHLCHNDGRMDSFLCPNGTVFNQRLFVCDWWFGVDCPKSSDYYERNRDVFQSMAMEPGGFGSLLVPGSLPPGGFESLRIQESLPPGHPTYNEV
ncbi:unnamed protein product [Darwinula stevensoni]|uniref:Chitin-binding type-2 domain-containing protein n=1 Tax=Darwinula stevensoni TaxID=69355 RepID=A0A7R8X0U6_9CRUS|nr:unnamed protein product [Darwinula stevensoni]CAG0882075.1 unnamed protein product [Darwinula stevensoni]